MYWQILNLLISGMVQTPPPTNLQMCNLSTLWFIELHSRSNYSFPFWIMWNVLLSRNMYSTYHIISAYQLVINTIDIVCFYDPLWQSTININNTVSCSHCIYNTSWKHLKWSISNFTHNLTQFIFSVLMLLCNLSKFLSCFNVWSERL